VRAAALCIVLISSVFMLSIVIETGMMSVQFGVRGANMPYNPNFADEHSAYEYGGYSYEHGGYGDNKQQGFGGRGRGGFGGRSPMGFRGRYIHTYHLQCVILLPVDCKHSFISSIIW